MTICEKEKLGAAEIAGKLRRQIVAGTLQNQDRLPPERQLAEIYGVARGTIREALVHLVNDNFLEIRPSSGSYVTFKSHTLDTSIIETANPLELMDARFALEPHICRLAVLHGRKKDFSRLEEFCIRMENHWANPTAFSEADTEFHKALSRCTGNGLLIWMLDQITSVRSQDDWKRMRQLTLKEKIIRQYNGQHRRLLDAIRSREPERAANIMKEHLETARLSMTRAAET